ncbi:hypothetical protein SARC_03115 [Sphaeroforma arctica JP610]|uniref:Ammonium transporter AmtB-like domain-containing protein n=1 Tax=Sphaeroforma arctica JP610 TaxID=667725 RepID=A0A0L0G735_9EUKA|nr:hypothetical protein SARC_03115 [Sphaeroforma arctica JP610]KNC84681.1 hypothetical protein SARC_03115 [Sphaeroforma arctica JP610]|eukprot:XP_014158583.1 hypothetical protein SARC_03115 [Sphaeroforma arctica JP610]
MGRQERSVTIAHYKDPAPIAVVHLDETEGSATDADDSTDSSDTGIHQAPDIKQFTVLTVAWQIIMLVLYAVWIDYEETNDMGIYPYFRDTSIMVFFGFGFLMSFLRHHGFSSITWTLLFSVMAAEWGILLELFFIEIDKYDASFDTRRGLDIHVIIGGLFAAATVMISFGAVLGKVTPCQLAVLAIVEPFFFHLNIYICAFKLEAVDVGGGMYIHMFGAVFGLVVCYWLRTTKSHMHEDESSVYVSDMVSLAGTLFLWMLWPSFNASIASTEELRMRTVINTFLSLCGSTVATIMWSRILSRGNRIDVVHVQNSTLAGGVAMGVIGDLAIYPATAIGCGFVAGTMSTVGYVYLTPHLHHRYGIQDVCGVVNLHGTPGLWGSLIAVVALIPLSSGTDGVYPHDSQQPLYQLAATAVSIAMGIVGGLICGVLMNRFIIHCCKDSEMKSEQMFRDCSYWQTPLGFPHVISTAEQHEHTTNETNRLAGSTTVGSKVGLMPTQTGPEKIQNSTAGFTSSDHVVTV